MILFPNIVILDNTFLIDLPLYHKASFLDAFVRQLKDFGQKEQQKNLVNYRKELFFLYKDYKHYFYWKIMFILIF